MATRWQQRAYEPNSNMQYQQHSQRTVSQEQRYAQRHPQANYYDSDNANQYSQDSYASDQQNPTAYEANQSSWHGSRPNVGQRNHQPMRNEVHGLQHRTNDFQNRQPVMYTERDFRDDQGRQMGQATSRQRLDTPGSRPSTSASNHKIQQERILNQASGSSPTAMAFDNPFGVFPGTKKDLEMKKKEAEKLEKARSKTATPTTGRPNRSSVEQGRPSTTQAIYSTDQYPRPPEGRETVSQRLLPGSHPDSQFTRNGNQGRFYDRQAPYQGSIEQRRPVPQRSVTGPAPEQPRAQNLPPRQSLEQYRNDRLPHPSGGSVIPLHRQPLHNPQYQLNHPYVDAGWTDGQSASLHREPAAEGIDQSLVPNFAAISLNESAHVKGKSSLHMARPSGRNIRSPNPDTPGAERHDLAQFRFELPANEDDPPMQSPASHVYYDWNVDQNREQQQMLHQNPQGYDDQQIYRLQSRGDHQNHLGKPDDYEAPLEAPRDGPYPAYEAHLKAPVSTEKYTGTRPYEQEEMQMYHSSQIPPRPRTTEPSGRLPVEYRRDDAEVSAFNTGPSPYEGRMPPVPFRPGLLERPSAPPALANHQTQMQHSQTSLVQRRDVAPVSVPTVSQKPAALPVDATATGAVTIAELNRLRVQFKEQPQNHDLGLLFAKRLVEAAKVLSSENGKADAKKTALNREKYILDAHRILKKLISGHPPSTEAMFYLADCHGSGQLGLEQSPKDAFALYNSAAKLGHAQSAYRVAVCCELGHDQGGGTKRDFVKAVQFYKRAAMLGHAGAMYKMGMVLLKGLLGQSPNPREGVSWLKRAAERADKDNPHALHELGLLYESQKPPDSIIRDERYACELFTRAAELGYKHSQYRLGSAYEYSTLGCATDARSSIAWYSKAAQQGEHASEFALSGWYLTGATVGGMNGQPVQVLLAQDDAEAYLWARKAAMSGFTKAEYAMGYYTEVGIGVQPNLEEAKKWYFRAAAQNDQKSRERLEDLRRGGRQKQRGRVSRKDVGKKDEGECVVM